MRFRLFRHPLRTAVAPVLLGGVLALGPIAAPAPAGAQAATTVVHPVDSAPKIGLVGDSTLAGVRWYDNYGDLRGYSFVFDAESCRRTLETSCWSREGYRPTNALEIMQQLSGQWGQVLVVMTGYDDTRYLFDDGVDALIAEAQRQGVQHVVWLTLRTVGVDYEEPNHEANGWSYRESNRVLLSRAAKLGGYLQVADWATASDGHDSWLEPDGVHVTAVGATALADFIADQVGRVLRGESITPAAPPWAPLREGDAGDDVTTLQKALVAAGSAVEGGADGTFGLATTKAVMDFQRQHGLRVSGVVDDDTAEALGIGPSAPPAPGAGRVEGNGGVSGLPAAPTAAASLAVPIAPAGPLGWFRRVLAVFALLAAAVVARGQQVKRRRARLRRARPPREPLEPRTSVAGP